ncbi:ATP-binding protein [Streptomyces sp. NPDC054962]
MPNFGEARRTCRFLLPAEQASSATARRRADQCLLAWRLEGEIREHVALVISELVTNAFIHTDSRVIVCELRTDPASLHLQVTDEGASGTALVDWPSAVDAEHGRGLCLVAAMTHSWGNSPAPQGAGHMVWARWDLAPPRPPSPDY